MGMTHEELIDGYKKLGERLDDLIYKWDELYSRNPFLRCTKCDKIIDKHRTYIMVHKQDREVPFCEDCGIEALHCMKWYLEFVETR